MGFKLRCTIHGQQSHSAITFFMVILLALSALEPRSGIVKDMTTAFLGITRRLGYMGESGGGVLQARSLPWEEPLHILLLSRSAISLSGIMGGSPASRSRYPRQRSDDRLGLGKRGEGLNGQGGTKRPSA